MSSIYKRCPRCNKKMLKEQPKCEGCGLIFSRLKQTTNRAGKIALKNKEYNKVVYSKDLPQDVNKWKLFFTALLLGFFGVHYAKTGKKMFWFLLIADILILLYLTLSYFGVFTSAMLEDKYWGILCWGMILPASFGVIIWLSSVVEILFNNFKVPIAIDENIVVENIDSKVAEQIVKDVKIIRGEEKIEKKKKAKIRVVCESCGCFVKVDEDEKICPKCDEPLKE